VGLGFVLGELEQHERALHVDVMRTDRRELGACRQKGCEMEHEIHLELGQNPFEQPRIQNRSDELPVHEGPQIRIERREVERHDLSPPCGAHACDQPVTHFPVRARDEADGFAHGHILGWRREAGGGRWVRGIRLQPDSDAGIGERLDASTAPA
jgi:hypothetical protein